MSKQNIAKYDNQYIAFIDVLGFGSLVEDSIDPESGLEIVERISNVISGTYELTNDFNKSFKDTVRCTQFSDSFVISYDPSKTKEMGRAAFSLLVRLVIDEFLEKRMVLRGGITYGPLIHKKDMVFGPAMNRAYFLESKVAAVPRIVFDREYFSVQGSKRVENPLSNHITTDTDGHIYIEYIDVKDKPYDFPRRLSYIGQMIVDMPKSADIQEKKGWMLDKYNKAVSKFSLTSFMKRWEEDLEILEFDELDHYLSQEEEIFAAARSLELINPQDLTPDS